MVAVLAAPDAGSPNCQAYAVRGAWSPPGADVLANVAVSVPGATAAEKAAVGGEGGGEAAPEYVAASWLGPVGQMVRSGRRWLVYVAVSPVANAIPWMLTACVTSTVTR